MSVAAIKVAGENSQPALSECRRSIEAYGEGKNSIDVSRGRYIRQGKIVITGIKEKPLKAST